MRTFTVAALCLVALAAPGCDGCGKAKGPRMFIINNGAEPQTLDPGLQKGVPEHRINICIFEGLTVYDGKDLSIKPGIAEKWDLSEDGTVYTFHLRDAKWSNGEPVTAKDFEWSWKRVLDPALGAEYAAQIYDYLKNAKSYYGGASSDAALRSWAGTAEDKKLDAAQGLVDRAQKRHVDGLKKLVETEVKNEKVAALLKAAVDEAAKRPDVGVDEVGVKAKDDKTLVVTLEASTPYFLDLAAFFTYFPVHRATVEKHGSAWTKPENSVCNGPYRMKEWKIKEYILLEKNAAYWDAAHVNDQPIKLLPVEETNTAFNMYEKKTIDWLTDVPREYIDELMKRPDYHSGPFFTVYFYGFNCKKGATQDKRVRRALSLAIDKQEIVKHITMAGEAPALSIVPSGIPGYVPATMAAFNVAEARKLLAEAGFPEGKGFPKIEILYNTQESHKKIASAIQEMWRTNLGIETDLRNVEWKIYLDMQSKLQFDVIRRGWVGDYTDPNTFIDMFMKDNGNNNTGWGNATYDKLVTEAARERDPKKRMGILRDAEAILLEEQPIVPLYFYVTKNMWRADVTGLYDNVRDTHPLQGARVSGAAP